MATADAGGASADAGGASAPPPLPAGAPHVEPAVLDVLLESYEGERDAASGLPDGAGKAAFRGAGARYEGAWERGLMHGRGEYTWPDGVRYAGDFVANEASGEGRYEWPAASAAGAAVYEGAVLRGERHGRGTLTLASGASYTGDWVSGARHGVGVLRFAAPGEADCGSDGGGGQYEGEWVRDRRHGRGVMQYPSGNVYEGGWVDDVKHGSGTMTWKAAGQRYTGEWVDGKPNGRGVMVWFGTVGDGDGDEGGFEVEAESMSAQRCRCNRYEGEFVDGERHGEGVFYYSTGATYAGSFVRGHKHGTGIFVFEDGSSRSCEWVDDRAVDPATGRAVFLRPDSPNGVTLRLGDVLALGAPGGSAGASEPALEADAEKRVLNLLLEHCSELRALYRRYAAHSPVGFGFSSFERDPAQPYVLALTQLSALCMDAGIGIACAPTALAASAATQANAGGRMLRMEEIREAALAALAGSAIATSGAAAGEGVAEVWLLYRDFAETLVRLAHARYRNLGSLPERVSALLVGDLQLSAGTARAGGGAPLKPGATTSSPGAIADALRAADAHASAIAAAFHATAADAGENDGSGLVSIGAVLRALHASRVLRAAVEVARDNTADASEGETGSVEGAAEGGGAGDDEAAAGGAADGSEGVADAANGAADAADSASADGKTSLEPADGAAGAGEGAMTAAGKETERDTEGAGAAGQQGGVEGDEEPAVSVAPPDASDMSLSVAAALAAVSGPNFASDVFAATERLTLQEFGLALVRTASAALASHAGTGAMQLTEQVALLLDACWGDQRAEGDKVDAPSAVPDALCAPMFALAPGELPQGPRLVAELPATPIEDTPVSEAIEVAE